jgi:hypothetical protein
MDLARAPRRAPLTARKKGSRYENAWSCHERRLFKYLPIVTKTKAMGLLHIVEKKDTTFFVQDSITLVMFEFCLKVQNVLYSVPNRTSIKTGENWPEYPEKTFANCKHFSNLENR